MKTPVTYYGGKAQMAHHILPLIPPHYLYCEPFCGGGAIFFAKEPSPVEVINDLNKEVINFYEVLKKRYAPLKKLIGATLHSREQHRKAQIIYQNPELFNEVTRAWAFWTLANNSFSAIVDGGWAYENKTNGTTNRLRNKKRDFTKEYSERLESLQIECKDALKVIKARDNADTFFYCDPPYFNSDMGHYKGYTLQDFTNLLDTLAGIRGKFLLSSYPSDILKEYAKKYDWHQVSFEKMLAVCGKRLQPKLKTEVLTANFPIRKI